VQRDHGGRRDGACLLRPGESDGQVRRQDAHVQGWQLRRRQRLGFQGWGLGIGKYTVPPAKPKFKYFGVAYIGSPKAGTYKKGEFVVTFFLPGKTYTIIGSPLGKPSMTVTVTKGAKKGTFSGRLNGAGGPPVSGSWSC